MKTLVWSEGSGRHTASEVVADFARHFWAEPRTATAIDDGRFKIVDGAATYLIQLERDDLWKIYRMER